MPDSAPTVTILRDCPKDACGCGAGAGTGRLENRAGDAGREMATEVEAQIAGSVWKIEKGVGDTVAKEDVLIIIESMKMEIPVEAPCAGRIAEIRVAEGDSIEEGTVLATIE